MDNLLDNPIHSNSDEGNLKTIIMKKPRCFFYIWIYTLIFVSCGPPPLFHEDLYVNHKFASDVIGDFLVHINNTVVLSEYKIKFSPDLNDDSEYIYENSNSYQGAMTLFANITEEMLNPILWFRETEKKFYEIYPSPATKQLELDTIEYFVSLRKPEQLNSHYAKIPLGCLKCTIQFRSTSANDSIAIQYNGSLFPIDNTMELTFIEERDKQRIVGKLQPEQSQNITFEVIFQ